MFSKPFLKALDDHSDGITCMAKNMNSMIDVVSGSADGEIIMWNMHSKVKTHKMIGHSGAVRGLTYSNPAHMNTTNSFFLSSGADKKICIWSANNLRQQELDDGEESKGPISVFKPKTELISSEALNNIDHSYENGIFATSGHIV